MCIILVEHKITLNSTYNEKKYAEILLHYRQIFIVGDVFVGEWGIFGVDIFLCYSWFFVKGNFVIGGVECNKKKSKFFFVVPGNGQTLLGMPDTDTFNIIYINIHSICAEDTRDSEWCANVHTVWESTQIQETYGAEKCYTNKTSISKSKNKNTKPTVNAEANNSTRYFIAGPNCDSDKRRNAESTQQIHKDFDKFSAIGCFEGIFSLQLKPDSKPYQALLRCMAYALQKLFQDELERLQQHDIIALLGVNETLEWCNSFVLVTKSNSKGRLCLDPGWLNQALIRPIHRGPTLNDILPKLNSIR